MSACTLPSIISFVVSCIRLLSRCLLCFLLLSPVLCTCLLYVHIVVLPRHTHSLRLCAGSRSGLFKVCLCKQVHVTSVSRGRHRKWELGSQARPPASTSSDSTASELQTQSIAIYFCLQFHCIADVNAAVASQQFTHQVSQPRCIWWHPRLDNRREGAGCHQNIMNTRNMVYVSIFIALALVCTVRRRAPPRPCSP